ncbi:Choline transport protein like [Verticillium longisporum]|uniref:Choline transport protein like n=1 Tax=Verticillium longisporum TaxID=100787 RepID=A0A8I2Z5K6_VERLO|nr:Choline transport protein like [Verticillium longisporum]KAG7116600.1 Choline transport protein like [Verticillium longisporum]
MSPPPVEGDAESQAHLKRLPTADQAVQDALDLAELGHAETLTRKFSLWSMFFLAFSVLGTWSTFAQGLSSGLTAGGPVAILWGLVLVFVCNICVAVSLAEMCSAMPTAMGQAYWIWRLWPGGKGRFTSYLCAWINKFGWWTLSASQVAFMTDFMLSMKVLYDPDWDGAHGWVRFLLYLAVTAFVTLFNVVACRRDAILPMFNNFVGICFVTLFFVFSLALLISVGVKDGNSFQPASFVFGRWLNQTGWNDGVTWFLGLVQAAYGLTAFDAAIHLVEEIPAPRKNIPRVMWLSVTMGAVSGFIFMVVCLFCIQDLDAVIDPSTGLPFMDLLKGTTGLTVATVLLSFFIFNGMGQAVSIVTTASRLTWSFARDGGIPWSPYFSKVNETWRVPVRALWLQGGIIGLIGVLYTFADTVLEAILGVSVIALTVSYGMPVLVLLMVGRDKLPPAEFKLGRFGTLINWISVFYCAITSVFFFFPGTPNPTVSDMNYAIAVFGIMMVVSLGFWVTKGRLTYLRASEAEEVIIEARRTELSQAAADHPRAEGTGDVKDTTESFRERRQS